MENIRSRVFQAKRETVWVAKGLGTTWSIKGTKSGSVRNWFVQSM
jgi:hypothetical protein